MVLGSESRILGEVVEISQQSTRGSNVWGKVRRADNGKLVPMEGDLMRGIDVGVAVTFRWDPARKIGLDVRKADTVRPGHYPGKR